MLASTKCHPSLALVWAGQKAHRGDNRERGMSCWLSLSLCKNITYISHVIFTCLHGRRQAIIWTNVSLPTYLRNKKRKYINMSLTFLNRDIYMPSKVCTSHRVWYHLSLYVKCSSISYVLYVTLECMAIAWFHVDLYFLSGKTLCSHKL